MDTKAKLQMICQKRPVLLASLAALASFMIAWGFLKLKANHLNQLVEPATVFVAKQDIPEGTPLDEVYLATLSIPKRFVQPAAVVSLQELSEAVTAVPILKGEQIVATKLTHLLNKTGLSVRLPEGMRAITLSLDEPALSAGLIRPGNFVDVVATFEMANEADEAQVTTQTLIQRASVLAVGEDIGGVKSTKETRGGSAAGGLFSNVMEKSPAAVTLALTPQQAQTLSFALDQGRIKLVLRPQWEEDQTELPPITAQEIVGFRGSAQRSRKDKRYLAPF